jgi:hypothetical protein
MFSILAFAEDGKLLGAITARLDFPWTLWEEFQALFSTIPPVGCIIII